ncbi:MAG: aminotransferase class I/II-fold pyridoxal phosphate-dependent enzyme [Halobacteriales archaeon]|nr:aminotransferase class I/II-fold pyridoxal phosphate-dependent enzyme [Halobacteriales archaeon]
MASEPPVESERVPPMTTRVTDLEPTAIREMFNLADEQEGDLVRLEIGEPDFDTPGHIIDAAAEAAHDGATHYTSNAGVLELREAIAEKSKREHDLTLDPETEIAVTGGGMEALFLALLAVAGPDEDVLVPTPAWPNYTMQSHLLGANGVEVPMPKADDYQLDADRVIDRMSADTAAVVVNTPTNPTGRIQDLDEIERLVDAAAEHDAYVIADEVYKTLTYDDGDPTSTAAHFDKPQNMLVVNSCSKQYAMTGWRLGWLAGPEPVIEQVCKAHISTTTCASSLAQYGAIEAMTGPQEPIEEMYDAFKERRDFVAKRIDEIPGIDAPYPQGGFYAFIDISEFGSSYDVASKLITDYGVVTVPGTGFGEAGEGSIRISFANSLDRLELAFERIEAMATDERR